MASRRPKWRHHPPPPPTPRILHFPRRRPSFRRDPKTNNNNVNRLGTLIDRERRARVPIVLLNNGGEGEGRRERVESMSETDHGWAFEEEKWKFQAEMLRAECNLLRMEKEIAVKKLQRTRVKMEKTLRSALHTLVSGRIKICEGKKVDMVLDEEIHELTEKLQRLYKRSKVKDSGAKNNRNFDKQVSVLQRRLEKIGGSSDEIYLKEFQEMENISLSIKRSGRIEDNVVASGKLNVEILRRKMEGLSKGILLQRMEEEYNSLLSTASSSLTSSGSNAKRVEFQDPSSVRVPHQEKLSCEGNACSGHCKTVVRRIVEQVRAETEQWSQMQEMLGKVREEMEELQASRDFWEDRARHSDFQIQSLHNTVHEWKEKALSSESKTNELEAELSILRGDLEKLKKEQNAVKGTKCSAVPIDTHNELEKRIVVCCSKENNNITENSKKHDDVLKNGERKAHGGRGGFLAPKRSPLGEIGNGKAVFPLRCHLSSEKIH
ncbi:vimentin [Cajanus cajan]|uniref:Uncharacterized protein n=1 Tax=Cajanus cajan TaxID=3821 RepID=A0A151TLX9_CAJCA|nr:vimentin [Cajanus cajan]KYP68029.1 hypothetical protein KK1_021646 [Cajanus cajan]